MKSKSGVITLSFLFGSTGAARFILGQNRSGWTLLLFWYILFPSLIYAILQYDILHNYTSLYGNQFIIQIGISLVFLFHLIESVRFISMKSEKFKSQDKSTRNTIPLTIISIVLAVISGIGSSKIIEKVGRIDIVKTDAELVISASQMSAEFRADEVAYRKKYDNRVIQVEGMLALPPGEDFETGTTYIELKGSEQDPFGIKCFFLKENSSNVKGLKSGDPVVVKGECNGNILNNCLLVEIASQ